LSKPDVQALRRLTRQLKPVIFAARQLLK